MVSLPTPRPGHSLAELVVALTVLAATLGAISSSVLLASRWTEASVLRQRALSTAEAVLDSLTARPDLPVTGSRVATSPPWLVEWQVDPQGARANTAVLRVTVTGTARGAPAADVRGLWIPPLPGPLP
jgi:Tfp pilus assembly protein PilV